MIKQQILILLLLFVVNQKTQAYPNKLPMIHDQNITIKYTENIPQFYLHGGETTQDEILDEVQDEKTISSITKLPLKINAKSIRVRRQFEENINHIYENPRIFVHRNRNWPKYKHYYNMPKKTEDDSGSRIIFPDENEPARLETKFNGLMQPPECQSNTTICEDIPNYPKDLIRKQLKAKPNYRYLEMNDSLVTDVGLRFGESAEDSLCLAVETIMRPKAALNIDKQWLFVINDEHFVQAIRVEICKNENKICNLIDDFAVGYTTACKQKYIYRKLVALDTNGTLKSEIFQLPASCCCHVSANI